jgi:hypothetical protein
MSRLWRTLLLVEVVLCFTPMVLILLLGALFLPFRLMASLSDTPPEGTLLDKLDTLGFVLAGFAGLVALSQMLGYLSNPGAKRMRPWLVLTFIIAATVAVLDVALSTAHVFWNIIGGMALLCTAHLVFLTRTYLFSWLASSLPSSGKPPN